MTLPRYLAIANPEGKRWQAYARELDAFWAERGVRPEVHVVPWREIVPRDGDLDGFPIFDEPGIVRLESPGRDVEVSRALLEAGARDARRKRGTAPLCIAPAGLRACGRPASSPGGPFRQRCLTPFPPCAPEEGDVDWMAQPFRKGELVRPGLLYRGFRRVLDGLGAGLARRAHLTPVACPRDIATLFDKNATAARLSAAGLPCPPSLEAPPTPTELLDALRGRRYRTAYVKLNTGSSAACMAVVHALEAEAWATTSMLRLGDAFFSTRRLQRVAGDQLMAVLEFLLAEDVCVQEGIAMARIDGQNFDVRVVVIAGKPALTVFRLSDQPMTNLHLGGRRGAWGVCRAAIPTRAWLDAMDHCVEAAGLFNCAMVGIDLLFEAGFRRHFILEINAFGDFFPGLTDAQGRSAQRIEIEATATRTT